MTRVINLKDYMLTNIYWSSIEYKYDAKSLGTNELKGGFVYAFIKANDVQDALENLLNELKIINLISVKIEFVKPYEEEMEWGTPEETKHYLDLFEESKRSTAAIFDVFYAFEEY